MAQVLAGSDAIPDNLFEFLDLRKPSSLGSRPAGFIADTNRENASVPGINAISPISVENVVRSSCAIHAARRSQRHCVQYSISIRGVLCMTSVQFSSDQPGSEAKQEAATPMVVRGRRGKATPTEPHGRLEPDARTYACGTSNDTLTSLPFSSFHGAPDLLPAYMASNPI